MPKCPFHDNEGQYARAQRIATWDDEDSGMEMARYRCDEDTAHVWERPTMMFMLRYGTWGEQWRIKREQFRRVPS